MAVKITCLGTGPFADIERRNSSFLCDLSGFKILVDCGYSVFTAAVRAMGGVESLSHSPDLVLLTHVHGDHTGSLPQLVLKMWEVCSSQGVSRQLRVLGELGAVSGAKSVFEIHYPGIAERFFSSSGFSVSWEGGESWDLPQCKISSAVSDHGVRNQSYRFDLSDGSFGISGDGAMTPETRALFFGVDLLIHEGHSVSVAERSHGSIRDVVNFALSSKVKRVALVHVHPAERAKHSELTEIIRESALQGVEVWLPNDGEEIFSVGRE